MWSLLSFLRSELNKEKLSKNDKELQIILNSRYQLKTQINKLGQKKIETDQALENYLSASKDERKFYDLTNIDDKYFFILKLIIENNIEEFKNILELEKEIKEKILKKTIFGYIDFNDSEFQTFESCLNHFPRKISPSKYGFDSSIDFMFADNKNSILIEHDSYEYEPLLHTLIIERKLEFLRLFLALEIDKYKKNHEGENAFHISFRQYPSDSNIIKILLESLPADMLFDQNNKGQIALDFLPKDYEIQKLVILDAINDIFQSMVEIEEEHKNVGMVAKYNQIFFSQKKEEKLLQKIKAIFNDRHITTLKTMLNELDVNIFFLKHQSKLKSIFDKLNLYLSNEDNQTKTLITKLSNISIDKWSDDEHTQDLLKEESIKYIFQSIIEIIQLKDHRNWKNIKAIFNDNNIDILKLMWDQKLAKDFFFENKSSIKMFLDALEPHSYKIQTLLKEISYYANRREEITSFIKYFCELCNKKQYEGTFQDFIILFWKNERENDPYKTEIFFDSILDSALWNSLAINSNIKEARLDYAVMMQDTNNNKVIKALIEANKFKYPSQLIELLNSLDNSENLIDEMILSLVNIYVLNLTELSKDPMFESILSRLKSKVGEELMKYISPADKRVDLIDDLQKLMISTPEKFKFASEYFLEKNLTKFHRFSEQLEEILKDLLSNQSCIDDIKLFLGNNKSLGKYELSRLNLEKIIKNQEFNIDKDIKKLLESYCDEAKIRADQSNLNYPDLELGSAKSSPTHNPANDKLGGRRPFSTQVVIDLEKKEPKTSTDFLPPNVPFLRPQTTFLNPSQTKIMPVSCHKFDPELGNALQRFMPKVGSKVGMACALGAFVTGVALQKWDSNSSDPDSKTR